MKIKCTHCGALNDVHDYECKSCGWEFGFEGGGCEDEEATPSDIRSIALACLCGIVGISAIVVALILWIKR